MKPEEKARLKIDEMLEKAGWKVVDRKDYSPTDAAVAIRETLVKGMDRADYMLFAGGKAIGILEAKHAEINVKDEKVRDQAYGYACHTPGIYQTWQMPLPFGITSNGEVSYLEDYRKGGLVSDDDLETYKRTLPTPWKLVRTLGIDNPFAGLPYLKQGPLRNCQYEAITELETSFRNGRRRALVVLATGAGKTYAACLAAYRFLAFTPMRRILFLVDRNNLGKQAEGEFGKFKYTQTGDPFSTEYAVNRLRSANVPTDSNVVISTIQRLFSLLKGDDITDDDADDAYTPTAEVELPEHPVLGHDFFDIIIIDECHRSIYGNWRKVLEYFDQALMIGLTATPIPETRAFFDDNIVINYTLEQSITDGVNVEGRTYRIKTEVTENGGAIRKGDKTRHETRYTGEVETITQREGRNYTPQELNRSIVNPSQIKLILETYRDNVYTEMFCDPPREANLDYLPKTLIFALNEQHANNIVRIAREVFGHPDPDDPYVQKITYSCNDTDGLIRSFRIDPKFRIAVTCTLVATGTDVKPLEVLIFMRDVESEPLFIQMKGRGVRTIGDSQLRLVTPNARSKDFFMLVDAVGVTEHAMTIPTPTLEPGSKPLTLARLMELLCHGNLDDEKLRDFAGRLSRIFNKANDDQRQQFIKLAGIGMKELASRIYNTLSNETLPPYIDINEPNIERKELVAPITHHPEAREFLLILLAGFVDTLMPGEDTLIYSGFSSEEAQHNTSAFEQFCQKNRDSIEALRIIWNNQGEPLTYALLKDLENALKMANNHFTSSRLWNDYALVSPNSVHKPTTSDEREALTNIIQLVRFAYHQITEMECLSVHAQQYFNLWCGQRNNEKTEKQREVMRQVASYIALNGAIDFDDLKATDRDQARKVSIAFGGLVQANEALQSLSRFILYRKQA